MVLIVFFSARPGYYVMKKGGGGGRIMHLFGTHNYRREAWSGIVNRLLSQQQQTFGEQAKTVSSGSI
jgi:transcriptional regulator CtsR